MSISITIFACCTLESRFQNDTPHASGSPLNHSAFSLLSSTVAAAALACMYCAPPSMQERACSRTAFCLGFFALSSVVGEWVTRQYRKKGFAVVTFAPGNLCTRSLIRIRSELIAYSGFSLIAISSDDDNRFDGSFVESESGVRESCPGSCVL